MSNFISNSTSAKYGKVDLQFVVMLNKYVIVGGSVDRKNKIVDAQIIDAKGKVLAKFVPVTLENFDQMGLLSRDSDFLFQLSLKDGVKRSQIRRGGALRLINEKKETKDIPINKILHHDDDKNKCLRTILNFWQIPTPPDTITISEKMREIILELYPVGQETSFNRVDMGSTHPTPLGSVIIPIYGRYDFIKHQISTFKRFGGLDNVELIYVIDDPSINRGVLEMSQELYDLYHIPFSLLFLKENVGFGMSNNIGVSQARSENLILMNSDVLPKDSSWATQMFDHIDKLPNAGIIGVRLLYENGSIQHDGMTPYKSYEYPGMHFIAHPFKGLHPRFALKDSDVEKCDMVTAACITIKKSVFDEMNGFDGIFNLGDFEDADLCMRVKAAGYQNYMCRDISLYHLERQSQNLILGGWRKALTFLNGFTYNVRWHNEYMYGKSFELTES